MPVLDIYDDQVPRRVRIDSDCVTVGRTADNEIIIHEKRASRQHCQIRRESDDSWTLHDLKSRNGTTVNMNTVTKPTPLQDGDEIYIGKSAIRFWRSMESVDPNTPKLPLILKNQQSSGPNSGQTM
ncbi:MAG: FHA domain-containing protein [Sedimentisphaerales bacterium]|nr:FHA domain-containing protein [Sedimentisphaerales bacterium]